MFEKFKCIKIQGGCFADESQLGLFTEDSAVSVIYGRNGSGKSTIARAIKNLAQPDEKTSDCLIASSDTPIPDDLRRSVFVFDDDFIDSRFRLSEEGKGIKTIVMFGAQVDLDNKIREQKSKLESIQEKLVNLETEMSRYTNKNDCISPLFHYESLRNKLRERWADVDRAVKGNTILTSINKELISSLTSMKMPNVNLENLKEQLSDDLTLYLRSKDMHPIDWSSPNIQLPDSIDELSEVLLRQVDKPSLSDREKRILDLLSQPAYSINDPRKVVDQEMTICPLCLRDITNEDRSSICQTLNRILNDVARDFEQELQRQSDVFRPIAINMSSLDDDLYAQEKLNVTEAQSTLNKVLEDVRAQIDLRISNLYEVPNDTPIKKLSRDYTHAIEALKVSTQKLCDRVDIFNRSVSKRKELRKKINMMNLECAKIECEQLLRDYSKAAEKKMEHEVEMSKSRQSIQECESYINDLNNRKANTQVAMDYINEELAYVFYNDRKMKLEAKEDGYELLVNGKSVSPRKISVGERNVLALCYFFASIFEGKEEKEKFASECLVVLDDPVSSFDLGNRVGVMSLLRCHFESIISGNGNSRILVLSHDLQSVFDLVKIRNEVSNGRNNKEFSELSGHQLQRVSKKSEYWKLLQIVYEYAEGSMEDESVRDLLDLGIGNIMRRVLEAFSTFCYNTGFSQMLQIPGVLNSIPGDKRNYYKNFMSRLVLNSESHTEESVSTLGGLLRYYSSEEKKRTARELLIFLYYVNGDHVKAYLGEKRFSALSRW